MSEKLYIGGTLALPARFQLGDIVRVSSGSSHCTAPVTGLCFRDGSIHYEVGGIMYASHEVSAPLRVVEASNGR